MQVIKSSHCVPPPSNPWLGVHSRWKTHWEPFTRTTYPPSEPHRSMRDVSNPGKNRPIPSSTRGLCEACHAGARLASPLSSVYYVSQLLAMPRSKEQRLAVCCVPEQHSTQLTRERNTPVLAALASDHKQAVKHRSPVMLPWGRTQDS